MELIEIRNITKSYNLGDITVPVLNGVSFQVSHKELIALMGASGSGKSTLMNILGCLDQPTSGEYWIEGEEVSRFSADQRAVLRNQKFGFVFQNFNLLPRTSALENVAMPLTYTQDHLSDRIARKRAAKMLDRVGLGDRMGHEPSQLSGGQQQRVAIARALINEPVLLLADEPTGNLDSHTGGDIMDLLKSLRMERQTTLVIATHDAKVATLAPRVIELVDGLIA